MHTFNILKSSSNSINILIVAIIGLHWIIENDIVIFLIVWFIITQLPSTTTNLTLFVSNCVICDKLHIWDWSDPRLKQYIKMAVCDPVYDVSTLHWLLEFSSIFCQKNNIYIYIYILPTDFNFQLHLYNCHFHSGSTIGIHSYQYTGNLSITKCIILWWL